MDVVEVANCEDVYVVDVVVAVFVVVVAVVVVAIVVTVVAVFVVFVVFVAVVAAANTYLVVGENGVEGSAEEAMAEEDVCAAALVAAV